MFINNSGIYTVESVTSGHPDKMCDQISDAILDHCLMIDPQSRVAVETFGGHGMLVVGGEITSQAKVDLKTADWRVYQVYREAGYNDNLHVQTNIVCQSPDIAQGVDIGGAGDQGIMYGYATNETLEFMPMGVVLAHQLVQKLEWLRKWGQVVWLCPDGKSQVTMKNGTIKTILVSCQHQECISQEEIRQTIIEKLIQPVVGDISGVEILVNPTGKFVQGGFAADTGLTGRKIMVDTYGGLAPHGGGCFSGKDPTKVDRSAAYMARFAAKNIVASGVVEQCLVAVAYAIGRAEPLMIEAFDGTGEESLALTELVKGKFDFRPQAIIERLNLRRPIYSQTACYGHFGRPGFPWEEVIQL